MNAKGQRLIDTLAADVCEYVGVPLDQFKDFCFESTLTLMREWHKRKPSSPNDIEQYYKENWKWYIGDLAWWHTQVDGRVAWFHHNFDVLEDWEVETVLDYGAGICTDSLTLAANNFDVIAADFNTPAFMFAKWRAEKHHVRITFATLPHNALDLQSTTFDCVILIDVIEHIPNYRQHLINLANHCWLMCISAPFKDPMVYDEAHPQHFEDYGDPKCMLPATMRSVGFHPIEGNFWVRQHLWHERVKADEEADKEESDKAEAD